MSRTVVTIHFSKNKRRRQIPLPAVFLAPIRVDLVHAVHTNVSKNERQPYAVSRYAGHQTSAESWGTGRAVSRIPRVPGGGTHRAGQGAFGNMCRGGRMFNPTKTRRRWKRKTNLKQRRFAVCSALAASSVPSLVIARGHRVEKIPEIPLVVSLDSVKSIDKTKKAEKFLHRVGAYPDIEKSKASKRLRAGIGKMRNRRRKIATGPLIVYNEAHDVPRCFRNIPGVELCHVRYLDILQLAPGAHLGRFIIWLEDAFQLLDSIFGTPRVVSQIKLNYRPPRSLLTNPNVTRLISSTEIQNAIRDTRPPKNIHYKRKNPLKNWQQMVRLNPFHAQVTRQLALRRQAAVQHRKNIIEARRKGLPHPDKEKKKKLKELAKKRHVRRKNFYDRLLAIKQHPERLTVKPKKVKNVEGLVTQDSVPVPAK
eukprot:TRINITY_DN24_c0_g2_i1.p1 TRINITY_DN24_c0_g2~~TRINITY_DN24_c0_g2_i1.p1  ORF type:complete len:423 (-),score=61.15 TRINITY_DN24_c0_g2_i1:75-1343(-)